MKPTTGKEFLQISNKPSEQDVHLVVISGRIRLGVCPKSRDRHE